MVDYNKYSTFELKTGICTSCGLDVDSILILDSKCRCVQCIELGDNKNSISLIKNKVIVRQNVNI